MRHSTAYGDLEILARTYGCRAVYAADIAGSGTVDGCIVIVSTSCAEIGYRPSACCTYYTAGLCSHKALVVDLCKKLCLYYLSLHQIGNNGYDRLTGIHYGSLGECIYITGELKVS